ncbi:transcription factor IIIC subunit delta N-term-domain-containing protein [Scleroderma yunnanense]
MSAQLPIYTALKVPTVLTHPSEGCLQWTDDGQLCLATKSAIYIFTPDHGINLSTPAELKMPIGDDVSEKPLGWYRTMFDMSRIPERAWAEICDDWGATTLGSLDVSIRAVACSPSTMSSRGRCVLVVLTAHEVTFWEATKNHLKGEWTMITNFTDFLVENLALDGEVDKSAVLKIQTSSIAWSSQPDFGVLPTPSVDASILALGSRGGTVALYRFCSYRGEQLPMEPITISELSDQWITHLAWSQWDSMGTNQCATMLAYAMADGGVGILRVAQMLENPPVITGFAPEYDRNQHLHVNVEPLPELTFVPDKRAITSLRWISVPGRSPTLVVTKPGVVHLWSLPSSSSSVNYWYGTRLLVVQMQRSSVGSTSLATVSGLSYVAHHDVLIIAFSDGSFHAIHGFSVEPSWIPSSSVHPSPADGTSTITSEALTQASRAFFVRTSPDAGLDYADVNRISGSVPYDSYSTMTWIYEALRPSDFSYKHEAKHECVLLSAPFWSPDDETILKMAQETLAQIHCGNYVLRVAPIHLLRPTLLHLGNTGRFAQLCPRLLEIVDQALPEDDPREIVVPQWAHGHREDVKLHLRHSLKAHFSGWDTLLHLQMCLSLADGCWKLCKDPHMRIECGQVAERYLAGISHRVLRIMVRHLTAIVMALTPADIPFVLRVVVQSLLPGSPSDLSSEAQALSDRVNAVIEIDPSITGLHEVCPACHIGVPLQDITQATCLKGHTWARCSVTSFILSTSMVRTCIGCSRKALLPMSQSSATDDSWMPLAARSWIVKELLEAVQRCLFCGNSFVGIV